MLLYWVRWKHWLGLPLAIGGLLLILLATLRSSRGGGAAADALPFWCLACGTHGAVDITLNVILFVPFALGLRLAGLSVKRVVAICFLATVFVESMQGGVLSGRQASLSDLLTNSAGGLVGALLAPHLRTFVLPPPHLAAKLAFASVTIWLLMLGATAWLLHPWSPTRSLGVGWGPKLKGFGHFSGRVTSAAAGGAPLYPGRAADSLLLHDALARGELGLQVNALVGPQGKYWAPIVALLGPFPGVVAAVYDVRDELILELPTTAMKVGFRNPSLRLIAGRPSGPGEPIRISAGMHDRTLWIASSYAGERRRRELTLSPSYGWSLVIPFQYAFGPNAEVLTALWVGGWLVPLGYWSRRAGSTPRVLSYVAIALGIVLAVSLGLLPYLTGYPLANVSEWIAGGLGLALGWVVASYRPH